MLHKIHVIAEKNYNIWLYFLNLSEKIAFPSIIL